MDFSRSNFANGTRRRRKRRRRRRKERKRLNVEIGESKSNETKYQMEIIWKSFDDRAKKYLFPPWRNKKNSSK